MIFNAVNLWYIDHLPADQICKSLQNNNQEGRNLLESFGLSITDKTAMWIQWCRAEEEMDIVQV